MPDLTLEKLKPVAAKKIKPFLEEILVKYQEKIHSIHVTGTAVTDDFNEKISDVNSIFVLKKMDLKFLELIAPLGKKYGKHKVAAPLIMTPDYIKTSLDVFPIEFLNFRLIHLTVFGEDILENLEINRMDLRHQCERELKAKLIQLRQGYISSQGNRKILTEGFVSSIAGYIPLFRGIISLFGKEPPVRQSEVITALSEAVNTDTGVFTKILKVKHGKISLSIEELNTIFEDYYTATEKIGKIIDEIKE
ncbi:MAG TPA: hypothetical protein ENG83_15255 [Nitrospirae bacterium]|nr:hypothetical protein BMS3Abin06_00912 [bacterium BMS3Abin06]HDH13526.1 hypothetical protein [Nitrospirota bacterium]HDZ01034.1 hypothetical protein [Nitrospirota bacterium]